MNIEVRIYLGVAEAGVGNSSGYPSGEKHAFVLYVAQKKNSGSDWERAKEFLIKENWCNVEVRKTGVASKEKQQEHPFSEMYPHALQNGFALLIYSGIEN
ncbi:MAG TPA: hypothetical protein VIM59_12630 [Cellvibrio sp.]